MRILTSGRGHFALLLLLMVAAILALMTYFTTSAPPPTITEQHKGANITFTAAHPAVWWNHSCLELSWQLSGITEVYINDTATIGETTEAWCLPPPSTYRGFYRDTAPTELRVRFTDGEIRRYVHRIYVMQPFLLRIVLPLLLIAAATITTLYIPPRYTNWLTQPRHIPIQWRNRLTTINWRKWLGYTLIVAAIGTAITIAYRTTLEPPYVYTTDGGDALATITIDPPVVFRSNGCTTLAWTFDNIESLELETNPVPPTGETEWCLPPRSSNSILQFAFISDNGSSHLRSVYIRALQPILYYTVLPILLLAAYCLRLHHRLLPAPWLDETRYVNNPLLKPFYNERHLIRPLLILFIAINTVAITNMVRHNSQLAYDGEDHFLYSIILSEGRLPTPTETNQFFAPPLVYVFPSLVHRAATTFGMEPCTQFQGEAAACQLVAKFAQLQNGIAVLGITYLLLLIAAILRPQDHRFKILTLLVIGSLPVFYKSLVFHRGEPFVALFTLLISHRLLIMLPPRRQPTLKDAAILGLSIGLLVISRQWGVFAAVGIAIWAAIVIIKRGKTARPLLVTGIIALVIALASGGWFYGFTQLQNGAVTAFNRDPEAATTVLDLKSLEFYIGLGSGTLFTEPFRSARIVQIIPIFYTETWGDYWGFFHLSQSDFSVWSGEPPTLPLVYMGQVNRLALIPTVILLLAATFSLTQLYQWLRGNQDSSPLASYALFTIVVLVSFSGYLWFLVRYPHNVGDTIKATYVLHTFPLLALLTANFLHHLNRWNQWLYTLAILLWVVIAIHNIPMLVTQYTGQGF